MDTMRYHLKYLFITNNSCILNYAQNFKFINCNSKTVHCFAILLIYRYHRNVILVHYLPRNLCTVLCMDHRACLLLCAVPQILALMVDLEDDPDWSVADEIEEDDNDRLLLINLYYY